MIRKLSIIAGPAAGTAYVLTAESVSVGRAPENTIHLDCDDVSRQHALLTRVGEDYRLRDLNSANGTFVNDQRIHETVVKHGDEVRFGGQTLRYEFVAARERAPVKLAVPVVAATAPRRRSRARAVASGLVWLATGLAVVGAALVVRQLAWPALAAPPSAPPEYRDPKGRFACVVPAGWTVVEDRADPRSKTRLVAGADEIRIIAQPTALTAVSEDERQAALRLFGETLERARAAGAAGRLLGARWRQIGGHRALEIELELGPPEYLWMQQLKFRSAGSDHTVALCVADAGRRADLTRVFAAFLESYRGLPVEPAALAGNLP